MVHVHQLHIDCARRKNTLLLLDEMPDNDDNNNYPTKSNITITFIQRPTKSKQLRGIHLLINHALTKCNLINLINENPKK